MATTTVFLHGKFHGWRSLVGYSPWGHKESDMTEWLHFPLHLSFITEILIEKVYKHKWESETSSHTFNYNFPLKLNLLHIPQ